MVFAKSKILLIVCMLLTLAQSALAISEGYSNYSDITVDFQLIANAKLEKTGSDAIVKEAVLKLATIPKNDAAQEVLSFDVITSPKASYTQEAEDIAIKWDHPDILDLDATLNSKVKIKNIIVPVTKKIKFPLEKTYTTNIEPTESIDINSAIRKKAQELVKNKDDLFEASFVIADWVKSNVKYDLSSLTEKVTQKASWVFENKEGVCDEITIMFMAMTRSLGIPTRFVSGIAYTNKDDKWMPHAWAEVYFEDAGWVPFDITFGQFGWIDPAHLKLAVSDDSNYPTAIYKWLSNNVKISMQKLNMSVQIAELGNSIEEPVSIQLKPLINKVGANSYLPVEVRLKNNMNHYLQTTIAINALADVVGDKTKYILLKPNELKSVYWILKGPADLDPGYVYTMPIEVKDMFLSYKTTNITFSYGFKSYSEQEAKDLVKYMEESKEEKEMILSCSARDYYFIYEKISVNCDITNNAARVLDEVSVCAATDCKTINLYVNETKKLNFSISSDKEGINQFVIDATFRDKKSRDILTISVLPSPDMKIINLNIPETVDYKEDANISFVMIVKAPVKDLAVYMNSRKVLSADELETSKKAAVYFKGSELKKSNLTLEVKYKDENNREYSTLESKKIKITNVPWYIVLLRLFGF